MEKIEGNNLIAQFMGTFKSCDGYGKNIEVISKSPSNTKVGGKLKYNTSYDWLIPVVVKCQELSNTSKGDDEWKNELKWKYTRVSDKLAMVTIMPLYEAVVEFIKWYNTNKTASHD